MRAQNKNNKILKFSIRKLSFGAAPVVIGALFFGNYAPVDVHASDNGINVNYTYLTENELTESEKSLIKNTVPSDVKKDETYYMIYKKVDQLSNDVIPEVKSLPNTGESSLPLAGLGLGTAVLVVFLISKKYRNKVLSVILIGSLGQSAIVPYHSFALENKDLVQYNTKATISNSSELAKGVIKIAGYRYIGFFTQNDLEEHSRVTEKILPSETKVSSIKQSESLTKTEKVEKIEVPKIEEHRQGTELSKPKIEYKTTPEEGVRNLSINKPELRTNTEVIPFETIRKFDNTLPKGETKVLKDGVNGEKVVFSEVTTVDGKETSRIIKTSITKNVVNKVIAVGTLEVAKGKSLVQPENPEGVVSEKGESLVQPKKPIGVVSEKGEPLVQPENPEGVVSEKGEPLVQPEKPEGVVSEKGEALVQPEKPEGVVSEKGEPLVQPEKPEGVVSEKGESLVQPEKPEGVVSEKGEPLVQPEKPVKEIPKEKKPPVLTLAKIEEHTLDRSANLTYTLENEDSVEIKSIVAEVRDGENVVKRLDLTTSKLKDIADNLKLYKDYIVRTTMIYNRGKVDETSVLEERPLRLDLKKVEVKNIKETSLIHVNEQGEESDSSLLNAIPENIKEYYLKVTSRDNKTTKLAIDKIEEVKVGEDWFYKVSAKAQDLVRRTSENKIEDTYSYYIAKPKPHIGDVYYDFKDLIEAMQKTPSGTFKLGADLSAVSIKPLGKSYVTQKFTGTLTSVDDKHYSIHNLGHPLFDKLENATIKNINLENVNINLPGENNVATLAQIVKGGTIENIKVTGSVTGANEVAGIVNKLDEGKMTNIAFIGKVQATGNRGSNLAGIAGDVWRGNIEKAYVDAEITGDRSRTGGIAGNISHGLNSDGIGRWGYIRNSVAKGTIDIPNSGENGGLIGKNWPWGVIENTVTMMDVKKGDVFFGSRDMDDENVTNWVVNKNFTVTGISKGGKTHRNSHRIKDITKDEADEKIKAMMITADKLVSTQPTVDKLNNKVSYENEYKNIQDYQEKRDQAYRNIEKLQPFYNKDWIVNQGNKLDENSNLVTKRVLSVTAMKDTEFVTDSENANKIMVHYADGTKELFNISEKESQVAQVKEYSIENLGDIVYTPNIVIKNRDALEAKVKELLLSVELQSQAVRNILEKRDTRNDPTANSEARQNGYIRDLFLEESFKEVRDNIDKFVKKLVENEEHQLNDDESAKRALIKKVELNKTNIMLGLTYLNRYYGIKYNGMNIKDMMTFKPDFYGKNVDVLDRLIKIGSKESYIKGDRTHDAYREIIAGGTGKGNLHEFLNYNMRLFTEDTDLNDWFKHATENNVYISEPTTTTQDFVNKKHRVYDGLNNGIHGRMILPLLNLKNAHIFLISTYNTLAYSSFEKYGKYTEEERNKFKAKIDEVANAQQRYLDFWSRLALSSVRNRLLKSDNMVPTAVWDNQNYNGGSNRYGFANNGRDVVAPVRELYGPTWRYHNTNGNMGAMARIYGSPNNDDAVFFMVTDMISQFGISAFTHETTHVNDRLVYYGGNWHREGTDLEAYAQGMLQTPDSSTTNGEYGALGLNMAYVRPNNGDQWYNYDPNKLRNRQEIDAYMKRYNEAMMMLDHLEADAVISKGLTDNSKWFRKIDKEYRYKDSFNELLKPNQWDKVRDLRDEEKTKQLTSINDLVDNNFATKHGVGNGRYRPEDFMPNSAYVNVNMMAGIYGGNSSDGAPGSLSFKHNAFRMWGYYGYEDGFISYVSNKYKDAANKEKLPTLSDKYIIKKVSKGAFETLEAWKKHWYGEVLAKAKHGFAEIDIDNVHITSYDQLQQMFNDAVQKDLDQMAKTGKESYGNTVALKTKVFKQLLKVTDGFSENLLGIIYAKEGNQKEALKWYSAAIEKGNLWAYESLAALYISMGDYKTADKWARKGLELAKNKDDKELLEELQETFDFIQKEKFLSL
mgnify:CR=1 FL=1